MKTITRTVINDLIRDLIWSAVAGILVLLAFYHGLDKGMLKVQTEAVEQGYGEWVFTVDGSIKFFSWKPKNVLHRDLEEDESMVLK